MFAIIGIVVVFGAVIGGFLMEKGHMAVLLQPAELLIIAGAATGTFLIANPMHIIKGAVGGLSGAFKGSPFGKARYLSTLRMMYQFLNKVRKEGLLSVEMDVEKPGESSIFKNYPEFLKDHHARDFVCDTLRTAITGGVEPFDMDQMMELDMEVHHHAATQPVQALSTVADALPGLGIVAAVLGVVITMGSLGGPARANRRKGRCRACGNVSRHPSLLWLRRAARLQHEQDRRRPQRISPRAASTVALVSQRLCAHDRHRTRPPCRAGTRSAQLRRNGKELQGRSAGSRGIAPQVFQQ